MSHDPEFCAKCGMTFKPGQLCDDCRHRTGVMRFAKGVLITVLWCVIAVGAGALGLLAYALTRAWHG